MTRRGPPSTSGMGSGRWPLNQPSSVSSGGDLSANEFAVIGSVQVLFLWVLFGTSVTCARVLIHRGTMLNAGLSLQLATLFMWGAFAAHAILAPTQRERDIALRLGVALELARILIFLSLENASPALVWIPGVGLGLGAIAAEILAVVHARGADRRRGLMRLQLLLVAPLSAVAFIAGLSTMGHAQTSSVAGMGLTYDHALYAFDGTLGLPGSLTPAGVMGTVFARVPILANVCAFVYLCEPLALMAMFAGYVQHQMKHRDAAAPSPLLAYVLAGVVLSITYSLCPAAGPAFAFGPAFPQALPDPAAIAPLPSAVGLEFARNCLPSAHAAFAWLAYLTVRDVARAPRWLRIIAGVYALLTVLATLGLGQHYLIDLVVAVPFTVALRQLSVPWQVPRPGARLAAGVGALAMVGIWVPLLRSHVGIFRSVPGASLIAVLTTLVLSVWLARTAPHGRSQAVRDDDRMAQAQLGLRGPASARSAYASLEGPLR